MKTRNIFGMMAAVAISISLAACSDNVNADLEPVKTQRTLDVKVDDKALPNKTLSLAASPSSTTVDVQCNTRWTVEITDCKGGWCDVDVINGTGDGSFKLSVLDNMQEQRDCYVTVYMTNAEGEKEIDGSYQIKVSQAVSDVRLSPSSLAPFAPDNNERQKFEIVSNVAWTLDVAYESENASRFISITPESGSMTAEGDGRFSGDGAASFFMQLQTNRTAADRKAYINLRSDVANYSVEITQTKASYTFDVSPLEDRTAAARGTTVDFGVLSFASRWNVTTDADWISFSRTSGDPGESRVSTIATIFPNTTLSERDAVIHFIPEDKSINELSLVVTQRAYDMAFAISRMDSVGIVPEAGGSMGFDLDSRFRWRLDAPEWLTASSSSGDASGTYRKIDINVEHNATNADRTGTVKVTPLPTEFDGGVTIDPASLGIQPVRINITQFGGHDPAISTPWLLDGYTQTSATVEFTYYSPFREITEAGLQWRKTTDTEWQTMTVTVSDKNAGTVSILLTGLDAATDYVARGFVKDSGGNISYGSVSYPFTTAGRYPTGEDNVPL